MTTQQRITIAQIEAQHEAERFSADQAAREVAQLDPRSVLIAIQVKLAEGNIEAARQIAAQWKAGQL
jgi:hypothetical protein